MPTGPRTITTLALALLVACSGEDLPLEDQWQASLDDTLASDASLPGLALSVRYGSTRFDGVAGDDAFDGEPLGPDALFRVASVTKTFTSAAVLVHVEAGELSLDDAIEGYLKVETSAALRDGGYDPAAITVRMLLDHTAGLYDYTAADAFYATIDADPSHRWTRAEQVALAMSEGSPLNAPGAEYHYGDTHYILAGEILEELGGQPLSAELRSSLRFAELGLGDTWLETLEDAPSVDSDARLTHPYIGEVDTRAWDPSWDLYGGGGLVSSPRELVRFFDGLFGGAVFAAPATLDALLEMPERGLGEFSGMDGGLGIERFDYAGTECFAGLGYFTTWVVRCPELDLTLAVAENQSEPDAADRVVTEVIGSVW